MNQREYLFWWLVNVVIAIVVGLVCLPYAHGRAPRYTIGDTVSADSPGTVDLAGECLKFAESADADTYLCRSGADEVTLTCGAAAVWVCNASGCDLAGELGSVTSLDATTESTIESAIDTLGDIATGSISQGDDKSLCQGADTDWCCEWDTDGTEGLLCTAADCDGLGGSCTAAHVYEDSGNLIADLKGIDSITNSSQKITIGPPGASSHSLSAGHCHFTCLKDEFEGIVDFDGVVNFRNEVVFPDDIKFYFGNAGSYWLIYNSTDTRFEVWTTDNNGISTNGKIFKVENGTDDITFYGSRVGIGGDGGGLGCINQTFSYTDFTDDGGASGHLDLDEQIPIGAVIVGQIVIHSLTGFTGDTTAVLTVGDDGGVDPDRYHSAGTLNVVASAAAGVDCGTPSGTLFHVAAVTVRLVLTGAADFGNFLAGEATISICYWTP